jgi:hypothetical protein
VTGVFSWRNEMQLRHPELYAEDAKFGSDYFLGHTSVSLEHGIVTICIERLPYPQTGQVARHNPSGIEGLTSLPPPGSNASEMGS